jgi:uncharacterized protein
LTSCCLIRPGAHRVMPWKNGGGATAEIAIHPPGATVAAGFDWRLSIATIGADGPFSAFPLLDRTIMLLAGNGMTLDFADGEHVTLDRPYRPYAFAGERTAGCRLIDGPCEDLNLMVARGLPAEVAVGDAPPWRGGDARSATRLLFVLSGRAECIGPTGRPLPLGPRDTLLIAPGEAAPAIQPVGGSLFFSAAIRGPRAARARAAGGR